MGPRRNVDVGMGKFWAFLSSLLAFMACAGAGEGIDSDMRLAPDIYNEGPLKVELFTVFSSALSSRHHLRSRRTETAVKLSQEPPRPLLIAAPKTAGSYPVVLFQHGYTMKNSYYSQMLTHIASHGFVVVAPQMYTFAGSDATDEIVAAGSVLDWFSGGLADALAQRVTAAVKPDLTKTAVVGHSRGGKVVFGMTTGICNTTLKISALIALDPVDGTGIGHQTKPPILKYSPHSLKLGIPTLIVGAALGSSGKFLFPACAPKGVNHRDFFSDVAAPAFHFVASEFGHMDYLDDSCPGAQGFVSYCMCKNGPAREPLRRFSGGIAVAFLQAVLLREPMQFETAFLNPSLAPVKLEAPELFGSLKDCH